MNPYLTDHDMVERILIAARRGTKVRVVVSETSNNARRGARSGTATTSWPAAGVEVWELPGTVVHAKVVVADDVVSFGTVNLDAWALYRNSEIMMIARSPEAAALIEQRLFEPDIARAKRAEPPAAGTRERLQCWGLGQAHVLSLSHNHQAGGEHQHEHAGAGGPGPGQARLLRGRGRRGGPAHGERPRTDDELRLAPVPDGELLPVAAHGQAKAPEILVSPESRRGRCSARSRGSCRARGRTASCRCRRRACRPSARPGSWPARAAGRASARRPRAGRRPAPAAGGRLERRRLEPRTSSDRSPRGTGSGRAGRPCGEIASKLKSPGAAAASGPAGACASSTANEVRARGNETRGWIRTSTLPSAERPLAEPS